MASRLDKHVLCSAFLHFMAVSIVGKNSRYLHILAEYAQSAVSTTVFIVTESKYKIGSGFVFPHFFSDERVLILNDLIFWPLSSAFLSTKKLYIIFLNGNRILDFDIIFIELLFLIII